MSIETLAKQVGVTYNEDIAEKGAKGLLRELPGYTAIADDVAELLSKHGKTLKLEAGKKELEEALALVVPVVITPHPTPYPHYWSGFDRIS